MSEILAALYEHNLWANLTLLDACTALGDDQLNATGIGGYGRIHETLVHLVAAEQRYLSTLTGDTPEHPLREADGFPGFEVLRARARHSGEGLIAVAREARSAVQAQYQAAFDPGDQPRDRAPGTSEGDHDSARRPAA